MPTQFGVFLKKLRLNNKELMKDMAEKLDVSPSFLSKVENGKEDIPDVWYKKIIDLYNLNDKEKDELKQAINSPQKDLKTNHKGFEDINKEEIKTFLNKSYKRKV